ncbi:MAG: type II toxin-antitoxin system Phd/YefM family antitoxin [Clostridiales bacterium]|nr:type II toxin-antitoxin system Phd/YefM family antitoxin [Clostridiales bacterium]
MEITATELKQNLGKYLEEANNEPVTITKNGKPMAQLIGLRTYKYDLSELEQWSAKMREQFTLGEATAPAYGASSPSMPADGANAEGWLLTHNGEPMARLSPVMKKKKKRILGFMNCGPVSDEENAELFKSDWTDEMEEEWLNQEWQRK